MLQGDMPNCTDIEPEIHFSEVLSAIGQQTAQVGQTVIEIGA